MRQAAIMKLFHSQDEKSVDFSDDPNMYEKLNIKKAKRGEEKPYDIEKIYRFQLEKDIAKIKQVRGSFKERNELYNSIRAQDPAYQAVGVPSMAGANGNFNDLVSKTKEESWRSTSKPYGIIAHKRYLEWLANLPKGPTEEEIKDKQQRRDDQDLWRKVVHGELEPTLKEIKRAERERLRRLQMDAEEREMVDIHAEERRRLEAIRNEDFEALRKLPTRREFKKSKKHWSKGVHYPYNLDKGFPVVSSRKKDQLQPANSFELPHIPKTYSSELILTGYYDSEKQYGDYLAEVNFQKAEKYIKRHYYQLEKERKKKEEEEAARKLQTRRSGRLGAEILTDVAGAKYLSTQEKLAYTVKVPDQQDREEDDNEEEGEDGQRKKKKSYEVSIGRKKQKKVIDFEQLQKVVQIEIDRPVKKYVYEQSSEDGHDQAGEEEEEAGLEEEDDEDSSSEEEEEKKEDLEEAEQGDRLGRFTLQINDSPSPSSPNKGIGGLRMTGSPRSSPASRVPSLLNLFRSASSHIFPETASTSNNTTTGGSSSEKKASSARSKKSNSSTKKQQPQQSLWTRLISWEREDVARIYRRLKKRVRRSSLVQFLTKDRRLLEPYQTPTERLRVQLLQDLQKLQDSIHHPKYLEARMELGAHELSMEEFLQLTKQKKRFFRQRRSQLTKRNATPEEIHELHLLGIREQALEEMIEERTKRYKQAETLVGIMEQLLQRQEETVRQTFAQNSRWERYQKYWLNRCFYSPLRVKKLPNKLENLLPNPKEREKMQQLAQLLIQRRYFERSLSHQRRRLWYRLTACGRGLDDLEAKVARYQRSHTTDDLLLTAQAGDYRLVIDILDPYRDRLEEKLSNGPVKINDISTDGMTATYACLSMILRKEVLDQDGGLDDLLLTRWQRRKKKFLSYFTSHQTQLLNQARFDYVLQLLLFYGGDLNFPRMEFGKDGLTILHLACQQGAIEMIDWLLKFGVDINQLSAVQYRTPLMFAVERDQLETMLLLLREGAILGIHHVDNLGNNVLHYASMYARPLITQILLICGVRPNIRNKRGFLPSEEAKMYGRQEIAVMILTYKDEAVDHLKRIDYLASRIDVPFDYHTGKGYDFEPPLSSLEATQAEEGNTITNAGTGHEAEGRSDSVIPRKKHEGEEGEEEEEDVFPVETAISFNNPSGLGRGGGVPSEVPEESQSPSTRRVNNIWNAFKRPMTTKTAYSSPSLSVHDHLEQVKADHAKSSPSLLSRINLPLSQLGRVSSVVGPTLVADTKKTRQEKATKTSTDDEVLVAPKLRRTVLQLNFSRKANIPSPGH